MILKKLKSLFVKQPKIIEKKIDVDTKDIEKLEMYAKAIVRENAQLYAKIRKLEKENKKLRKTLSKLKQDFETKVIAKEIEEAHKLLEKMRKESRRDILFKFKGLKAGFPQICSINQLQYFRDSLNNKYPYWVGMRIFELDGKTYFNLILSDKPKVKKYALFIPPNGLPFEYFNIIWEKPSEFFQQLSTGILKVRFDVDGQFLPPKYEIEK